MNTSWLNIWYGSHINNEVPDLTKELVLINVLEISRVRKIVKSENIGLYPLPTVSARNIWVAVNNTHSYETCSCLDNRAVVGLTE